MSSSNTLEQTSAEQIPSTQAHHEDGVLQAAPLPSRLLAALIDYLVVTACLFASSSVFGFSDMQFLVPLILGGLYLSAGNSLLFQGQTLGKRAFGLRVVSSCNSGSQPYLELSSSALRFLAAFGVLILGTELPPLLFRSTGFSASSYLLELHMLLLLIYSFSNIAFAVFDPLHRALHDRLSSSIVVRRPQPLEGCQFDVPDVKISSIRLLAPSLIAVLLSAVLWGLGSVHSAEIAVLVEQRYVIEKRFDIRILQVHPGSDSPEVLLLSSEPDAELQSKLRGVAAFLAAHSADDGRLSQHITFTVVDPQSDFAEPRSYRINTQSKEFE